MLGRPLSGVDSRTGDCRAAVGCRKADCGFNADPGRYLAVCGHAVLGRPNNISATQVISDTNNSVTILSN